MMRGRQGQAPPVGSFTDRVMVRVAAEPTPSPGRVFFRSLGHLAMRDAIAALATAWRVAFEPTSPVSPASRASAAALFLSVIIFVGLGGSVVTSGALALLSSDGPAPQVLAPGASPVVAPAVAEEPKITPSPTPSPPPKATPKSTPKAVVKPATVERRTPATTKPARRQPSADEAERPEREESKERETPEPKERETPEPQEREREEKEAEEKED